MKIFLTKTSKVMLFFSISLYLFTILVIPLFENQCHSYTGRDSDIHLTHVCCACKEDNSSSADDLKGNVLIPHEHNSCECENHLGFTCGSCKSRVSIISSEPQKKLSEFFVLKYENKINDFFIKEYSSLLYSPQRNSSNISIRSVILLI